MPQEDTRQGHSSVILTSPRGCPAHASLAASPMGSVCRHRREPSTQGNCSLGSPTFYIVLLKWTNGLRANTQPPGRMRCPRSGVNTAKSPPTFHSFQGNSMMKRRLQVLTGRPGLRILQLKSIENYWLKRIRYLFPSNQLL